LPEVVVVPDEDGELPGFPLLQLVGAGADRLAAEVLPEPLDLLPRHYHQVGDAQVVGERGRDLAEVQLEGVPVGDLAADQVGALSVEHLLAALDQADEAAPERLVLGRRDALPRVLEVGGLELAAVVELDALLQLDRVDAAIRADLGYALGE